MNKRVSICFSLLLLLLPLTVTGALEPDEDFTHYKSVSSKGEGEYAAFFPDSEVYRYAGNRLEDLRIYDSEGQVVPYYLQGSRERIEEESRSYSTKQFFSELKTEDKFALYDFQLLAGDNEDIKVNSLTLTFPNEEFSRQFELYGRNEESNWHFIGLHTIYKIGELVKERVEFGKVGYRFYRIKLLNSGEELKPASLTLSYDSSKVERERYRKELSFGFEEQADDDNATWLTIRNPNRLRLTSFTFDIEGNFNRDVLLYHGAGEEEAYLGRSRLYNIEFNDLLLAEKMVELGDYGIKSELIKLKIINRDDPPLQIEAVKGAYLLDRVVFKETGKGPYKLYFGNEKLREPVYDIETFKSYIEKERLNEASLGPLVTLKAEVDPSKKFPLDSRTIFNIVIGLVSVVLIVVLLMALRKKS